MEQSPSWEANRFTTSQEIPRILWNMKVQYRIHKCPPPVLNLIHINPVQELTFYFLKIHLNIILPSPSWSSKWSLSISFPTKTLYKRYPSYMFHMSHPLHSSRFQHPKNIGWGIPIIKSFIMQLHHSPVTSVLLGPNILLNTLFPNTLSLPFSLNVSDQISHSYKTTGKITVLYNSIFQFLDN